MQSRLLRMKKEFKLKGNERIIPLNKTRFSQPFNKLNLVVSLSLSLSKSAPPPPTQLSNILCSCACTPHTIVAHVSPFGLPKISNPNLHLKNIKSWCFFCISTLKGVSSIKKHQIFCASNSYKPLNSFYLFCYSIMDLYSVILELDLGHSDKPPMPSASTAPVPHPHILVHVLWADKHVY